MNKRKTGQEQEVKAACFLKTQRYQILERNYRCIKGEIDLIAREGQYLVFVEVKYRSTNESGLPEEAVDLRKQRQIYRVAAYEKTAPQQTESQRDYYYYTGNTTAQTPPPVWPISGSNPNGTSVNPNGFDFKSTMEDVGNNLKDKAKELFGENHPSNSSQNQQPVRTAGTCPNCGAELEPGAEYCKKCGYPVEK